MNSITRRDLFRTTAGAGVAFLAAPSLAIAADEPAKLYTLPKLPYAFDALEPHIDAMTMEIHSQRHHKAYVDNLNKALAGTDWAGKPIEGVLAGLDKLPEKVRGAVRNNGGGHYNHSLFWQLMSPKGGKPSTALSKAVEDAFKDQVNMFKLLKEAAMTRFGSGWAWVIVKEGKLKIVSSPNQDNTLMDGSGTPLLGIDVWEHAYYLKYQNKRADYVDAFFKVINWDFVSERFAALAKG
ncbi:MAG: superoxide dismutase [Gemmataceae bacterium]|nr:superoxide dismutase [Gemmataceae bacterium]